MSNIEELNWAAEGARRSLGVAMAATKHFDSGLLVAEGSLGDLLKGLTRLSMPEHGGGIQETTARVTTNLVDSAGFGDAKELLAALTEGSNNPHAQAAHDLTLQADETYTAAASEAARVGSDLEIALGMLAALTTHLSSIQTRIGEIRQSLHEVSGVWDGPIGQIVGPLIGRQTVNGMLPTAITALGQFQNDITGGGQ